jgi:hypothetical protein
VWEATCERVREAAAFILAAILVIPAGIIRLIDRLTIWRIRRRGGLD